MTESIFSDKVFLVVTEEKDALALVQNQFLFFFFLLAFSSEFKCAVVSRILKHSPALSLPPFLSHCVMLCICLSQLPEFPPLPSLTYASVLFTYSSCVNSEPPKFISLRAAKLIHPTGSQVMPHLPPSQPFTGFSLLSE